MRKQLKLTALTLGLLAAAQASATDLTVVSFGGANKAAQIKAQEEREAKRRAEFKKLDDQLTKYGL